MIQLKTLILFSILIINKSNVMSATKDIQTATFGSGCFWCVEAIFQQVKGVSAVKSGYMGGNNPKPTYKEVCNGTTGYAEVIQLEYDRELISFDELLEIFWKTHDPTTLNQQGADKGTQYRSAVFYHSEEQKTKALEYKKALNEAKIWENPIVTEITKADVFYAAEAYHQDYYESNKNGNSYCSFVITPKVEKFRKLFKDKIK